MLCNNSRACNAEAATGAQARWLQFFARMLRCHVSLRWQCRNASAVAEAGVVEVGVVEVYEIEVLFMLDDLQAAGGSRQ